MQQKETAANAVRMERRGKSSPASGKPGGHVNPTRCNTDRDVMAGPAVPKGGKEQRRRRPAKIDCRSNRTRLTPSVASFRPFVGGIFFAPNPVRGWNESARIWLKLTVFLPFSCLYFCSSPSFPRLKERGIGDYLRSFDRLFSKINHNAQNQSFDLQQFGEFIG